VGGLQLPPQTGGLGLGGRDPFEHLRLARGRGARRFRGRVLSGFALAFRGVPLLLGPRRALLRFR